MIDLRVLFTRKNGSEQKLLIETEPACIFTLNLNILPVLLLGYFPLNKALCINMPAKHYIDDKASLITTTWEGDATDIELLKALREYQKNIQSNPDYINYNEVFDLSKADKIRVTINGMINIGQTGSKTDHLFTQKKLALIVGSNVAFSLAKMYEVYRNMGINSCKTIRVFKNEQEAIKWVRNIT